jgi:hypothetical protein
MTKRPLGRPPLDATDPSVRVGLSLPAKQFDALCAEAQRAAVSVPEMIRRLLAEATPEKKFTK